MKEHWYDFKWIYIVSLIIILVLGGLIGGIYWYEYEYPCVYGHYEEVWYPNYGANGMINGGYYSDEFICDCRTVRDSIK